MGTVYKVLGQANPNPATPTTIYTVPAATNTIVSTINICNLSGANATFRVAVQPSGAALANVHYLTYDTLIPANDSIGMTLGITLSATDVIAVQANTSAITFSVFGTELT